MWKYFNLGKVGPPEWASPAGKDKKQIAIEYCLKELQFYEDWGRHNRIHWKIWQNIAIISGVLATVLAVLPNKHFLE